MPSRNLDSGDLAIVGVVDDHFDGTSPRIGYRGETRDQIGFAVEKERLLAPVGARCPDLVDLTLAERLRAHQLELDSLRRGVDQQAIE